VIEPPREHIFYVCPQPCPDVGRCQFCDGGILYCTVCGAYEGALLDVCPGEKLTAEQHNWNYAGNMRRWDKLTRDMGHRAP